MDWYDDFADWAEDQGDTWDSMTVAILSPYFNSDLSSHDFMWVNTWPSPTAQFAGLENWATDDGCQDLLSDIPSELILLSLIHGNGLYQIQLNLVLQVWMYAAYSECYLEEGYNNNNVYDGYVDFAKFAKENGDTVGRKMIVPTCWKLF